MNAQYFYPSSLLQPFIKKYVIIESGKEIVNRVLPDTSLAMAFRFKGSVNYIIDDNKVQLPSLAISGLQKSARLINYADNSGNILVLFKEAKAASFFKAPLHELFKNSIPMDNLFNRQGLSIVEEELAYTTKHIERINAVERFLISQLIHKKPDKLIEAAVQKIETSKGLIKAKDLADTFYISQDAFEKRFRRIVGSSARQYSSTIRMKEVIKQANNSPRLTDLALDTGFYDQAHFNKEFKLFTGQSPTDFFSSSPRW